MCFPFQVAGTHDLYRPRAAFDDGLPSRPMQWDNGFWDAGDGLVIFLGIEPWYRIDLYGQAFFEAVAALGNPKVAAVEGYNGPAPPDAGTPDFVRVQQGVHGRRDAAARHAVFQLRLPAEAGAYGGNGHGEPGPLRPS